MKRFSSQLAFCSPEQILRHSVIEQNDKNEITKIFYLTENHAESEKTLFYDGIISSQPISLKEKLKEEEISIACKDYRYVDAFKINETIISEISPNLLILDFGTSSVVDINKQISLVATKFSHLSVFEFIAAVVYNPAMALGQAAELAIGTITQLILWEGTDLVNKKNTEKTSIKYLNL